jgi:mRNA-degrading endonuclease RelE of RelBE toxin-antitoxin system
MREIIWQVKAKRQVKKIKDSQTRVDILDAVESLAYFPTVANVKALVKNMYTHRLKVGKYRVLFNAFERINITSIEEVKKRNERTYK